MAFCFPDTYEIGMSFLGDEDLVRHPTTSHENWWCERAFMPWHRHEGADGAPGRCRSTAWKVKTRMTDFDIIGFSLEYELCYTNILAMLRLSNIPLRAAGP